MSNSYEFRNRYSAESGYGDSNCEIEFDTDSLEEVCRQFKNFLVASGYDYVTNKRLKHMYRDMEG